MGDKELTDLHEKYTARVSALFAARSTLFKVIEDIVKKLRLSALSLSKYLCALYAASFLFLLSSHDQVSNISGGRGPVLWAMLVILACLILESFRALKLFILSGTQAHVEEVFKEFRKQYDNPDLQSREDFHLFLDQLAERFTIAAIGNDIPFKFNFFQGLSEKFDQKKNEQNETEPEHMVAFNNMISSAERAKETIMHSTDKLGKLASEDFGRSFTSMLKSSLVFFLYLVGLLMLLFAAVITNYYTMFSWVIGLYRIVMECFGQ